jgi:hypothetical protein
MEKLFPYALVSTAVFLASVVALFVCVRRRTGGWLALAGALPVSPGPVTVCGLSAGPG